MQTKFAKWPGAEKAKADTYKAEADVQIAVIQNEPGGTWTEVFEDRNGNWTCALLAAPFTVDGVTPIEEPASCAALRVDAVIVDDPEKPVNPED